MVNFGPLAADIVSLVWGTPGNFNGFRVLAALLHGTLVVGVSQTAALNTGRHLYSAGRPSRWALAHISTFANNEKAVDDAGDQDADGGRDGVRHLLAAAARVHTAHRLQTGPDRVREHLAEALLRRRLLGRALAGDEQQLRQPHHLRLPSRLFPGTSRYISSSSYCSSFVSYLWPPYVIRQAIIFLPCGYFCLLSSFFHRLISAVGDWMSAILSANLECRSEVCCTWLAENTGRKTSPKIRHLRTIA